MSRPQIPEDAQPIATAPMDGRWIIGFSSTLPDDFVTRPWVIASRYDGGFADQEGYGVDLEFWVPFPDPQPAPTNWVPPIGKVYVERGYILESNWYGWIIFFDDAEGLPYHRDALMFDHEEEADAKAAWFAERYGLTIQKNREHAPHMAPNVIPFDKGRTHR